MIVLGIYGFIEWKFTTTIRYLLPAEVEDSQLGW